MDDDRNPTDGEPPDAPFGARVADRLTDFIGSWKFIILQTVIVALWIAGNVAMLVNFDPFPFILLNLAFSTQAAYTGPVILLAGNRQAARDRQTLQETARKTKIEEKQNERLLSGTSDILERVEGIEQQLQQLESRILDRLPRSSSGSSDS